MYDSHFSLDNIPFGIASRSSGEVPTVVTRLYNNVIFLQLVAENGLLPMVSAETVITFSKPTLNELAALGRPAHTALRKSIQELLSSSKSLPSKCIADISSTTLHFPLQTRNFTDFLCSRAHLLNAGQAMKGTPQVLPPSFENFPIGYTGRTSTLVLSGTGIPRPKGMIREDGRIVVRPTRSMDYEMEVAAVIGKATDFGDSIKSADIADYIFGLVLMNDWSARDIQGAEMIPMGPLNSKSFATSISPWVVTTLALEPFACAGPQHSRPTASHLTDVIEKNTYDIHLCASLISPKSASATVICRSELRLLDWTIRDLVAQQTLNGCSIEVGDLLGSGTISGYGHDQHGCLLELNEGGKKEFELNNGEKRIWIEDGDSIQLTGWASDGVGFGECVGVVVPTR